MKPITIQPVLRLRGTVKVPGDKSISHRAAILAALAKGRTKIRNFLFSDDCLVTLKALAALGVKIDLKKRSDEVFVSSCGEFQKPESALNMSESGTSARVLSGVLSGQKFRTRLTGAASLSRRPMARVLQPLRLMGADVKATKKDKDEFLPFEILPASLRAIQWKQRIASAQVKSAILLAGLYADGETSVVEPVATRDHTERMLKLFKANITVRQNMIAVRKSKLISPGEIFIPGDISSAAFFIVAALLIKDSKVLIKDVGINPTRMGVLHVLERMGGSIKILNMRDTFEPLADIEICSSRLQGTIIRREEVPSLIDELPILMVAASRAEGRTVIEGAQELKVKETDRINSMKYNLMKLGVNIRVKALKKTEVIEIIGTNRLTEAKLRSFSDHRTAMSMFVAALAGRGKSCLDDTACIDKSFPDFLQTFRQLFD